MALFKVSKGKSGALDSQTLGDGFCWFTHDDGKFYIDYADPDDNGTLKRKALNAENADISDALKVAQRSPSQKAYLLADTGAPASSHTVTTLAVAENNIYMDTSEGRLVANSLAWNNGSTTKAYSYYNSTDDSIEFNFL